MLVKDETHQINEVIGRLAASFTAVPASAIAATVDHELARFDGSRIREFVPLFVERRARVELAQREFSLTSA